MIYDEMESLPSYRREDDLARPPPYYSVNGVGWLIVLLCMLGVSLIFFWGMKQIIDNATQSP